MLVIVILCLKRFGISIHIFVKKTKKAKIICQEHSFRKLSTA